MRILLSVLVVAAFASPAAAQTTINFDDLTASSCVYASAPDLAAQYTAMGVTFSGDISNFPKVVPASCLTISGASTPNIVGLSGSGNHLEVDFAPTVATVSMAVGNYNRIETFTLTAYDAAGGVLATSTFSPAFRMFGRISVSAPGITYVVLTAAHSENAIDDLTFSSSTTPVDAGVDAGPADAGPSDSGAVDGGPADAGAPDAGDLDAGSDASASDAGSADAGGADGGSVDAAATDAGRADASVGDAGSHDAGARDAASPDGGTAPHAGGGCCRVASGSDLPSPILAMIIGVALVRARRRR